MNIIVVDDEQLAVENILALLREVEPEAIITGFTEAENALSYLHTYKANIAFLDIEMGNWNGIEFAKKCKDLCPKLNIIFITGYLNYTLDALKLHASGYLMKPIRACDLKEELSDLRHPLPLPSTKQLRIQTFGNFEVFSGNEIVHFSRTKSKELFAYLVDRKGAAATMAEIAAVLWEDQAYCRSQLSQIHTFLADIKNTFSQIGHSNVLVKKRNSISVNLDAVDCDYYRFLQGDVRAINSFFGEYMVNYSWAEFTVGNLSMYSNLQKKSSKNFDIE